MVSTHSRLKAAGDVVHWDIFELIGFNTQPPKGGWSCPPRGASNRARFNTQPPKGGWGFNYV